MTSAPPHAFVSSSSSRLVSQSGSGCSPLAHACSQTCLKPGSDDAAVSVADRLVNDLKAYEHLLRKTLAAGGRLVTVAAEAQADRGLPAIVGHQIYHAFNAANLDVSAALANVARGHRQLEVLAASIGIDLTAYGKTQDPPAPGFFTSANASDHNIPS